MPHKPVPVEERCAARVFNGRIASVRCARRGTHQEEGKLWCTQHAPSQVKARREAENARYEAAWAEGQRLADLEKQKRFEDQRKLEAFPLLIEALAGLCQPPRSPVRDCPADISSEPCICGWHDALDFGKAALEKAKGG